MALQPAAGARDLNPGAVESNRRIAERLAATYRLWGYQEVAPPTVERLDSLEAGGAINGREIVRLAGEEPLGLRPELTAPIARAASTRMVARPLPLRLWACGSTFRSWVGDGGGQRISEELSSGVELLGVRSEAADTELLHLLLACFTALGLPSHHSPTLLVGHHGLLDGLLQQIPAAQRAAVRQALTGFDPLALEPLPLPEALRQGLISLLELRGAPEAVLQTLQSRLGPVPALEGLAATLASLAPAAAAAGVRLQLDPTFQPHFDLYDGLVFRLVCQGPVGAVAIASGGRYDGLVGRFGDDPARATAAGTGFGFAIEAIRELQESGGASGPAPGPWLVATAGADLTAALAGQAELHARGEAAELCLQPCGSQAEADALASERGCRGALWLGGADAP